MAKNEKTFDAVRLMRSIRNDLNEQMRGMTFEEQQAYIRERLGSGSTDRLSDRDRARRLRGGHVSDGTDRRNAG